VILDAWSRVVVGYAISWSIDARLTIAALKVAIECRKPSAGCVHHSDRGSQYAARGYRDVLADHDLVGSMGRRGNPYDNAKAENFMKTLKVEAVYAATLLDSACGWLPLFDPLVEASSPLRRNRALDEIHCRGADESATKRLAGWS
jgi:putative transposase